MRIEILYFDECPNHAPTIERITEALRLELLTAELIEINVQDTAAARSLRFVGSPTIRIDGSDIETSVRTSKGFGIFCRTYADHGKQVGTPPLDLIRSACERQMQQARIGVRIRGTSPEPRTAFSPTA